MITAHRHVEVSGDQQERDANAQDDDKPIVRDEVEYVLGLVKVRHNEAGNGEHDNEHADHEQGDERLIAQLAAQ